MSVEDTVHELRQMMTANDDEPGETLAAKSAVQWESLFRNEEEKYKSASRRADDAERRGNRLRDINETLTGEVEYFKSAHVYACTLLKAREDECNLHAATIEELRAEVEDGRLDASIWANLFVAAVAIGCIGSALAWMAPR